MNSAFDTSFPSEFDSYKTMYDLLYNQDLCENYANISGKLSFYLKL